MSNRVLSAGLFVAASVAASAFAQENLFQQWFSPTMGEQPVIADYDVMINFSSDTDQRARDLWMHRHELNVSVPVYQDGQREWTVFGTFGLVDIDSDARLQRSGPRLLRRWLPGDRLPGELYDLRFGTSYRQQLENGWIAGGSLSFGSTSDELFASGDEIVVGANGFLRVPHGERNAWIFLLNYSNNRDFLHNIPIPGFAYQLDNGPQLRALLGIPLTSVHWKPVEKLELDFAYRIPRRIHGEVSYRLTDPLKLYLAYDWHNDRWLRADRHDDDDRMWYYEQTLMAGVRWDWCNCGWLNFGAGYAFDRFFYEGDDFDDRHESRIDLDDGPIVRLQVGLRM